MTRPFSLLVVLALAACREDEAASTAQTMAADTPGALEQSNATGDLAIAQAIRRQLVADPGLSLSAKNAVVVVRRGAVTLRGSVLDRVEHDLVVDRVASVPGVVHVDDRLTFGKTKE